jgi:signal transduction histidine kinase
MPDGARLDPRDDNAEQAAVADDARLVKRTRWRLVAWSGLSTLIVLLVLAVALYASVARTLQAASVDQLDARIDPLAAFLEGDRGGPDGGPDPGGYVFGGGNTLLYLFDDAGRQVSLGSRAQPMPDGLPLRAGLAAARTAANGEDVRTSTLEIETPGDDTVVPIRVMTRKITAQADGNDYFAQALVDRTTEVETLNALLIVLAVGGMLVILVAFGFGALYARRALVPIRQSLEAQRGALRRQREFAADASHELRTPLTVIRSSVEHLDRHRDEPLSASSDALDDIVAEVDHLALMVDDLLLLARTDSGAVALERLPLDLGDVASDAASVLARTADGRGVSIRVDPEPAMLEGDPARLRQLVTILVDNAIRHSPRGGIVDVTVRAAGGLAWIEVADQGPGLRAEDMPHVFDRFYRAPGAPTGGTGLGLAIARWIVERHAGRIGVANRAPGGAVFRAELPDAPPKAPASPTGAVTPSPAPETRLAASAGPPGGAPGWYRRAILIAGPVRPVGRS